MMQGAETHLRERVLGLVKRHGWNSTSFQVLEPDLSYWFTPEEDACVAYVDTGRAWVAAGVPLAPEPRFGEVARQFAAEAEAQGRRACFFGAEARFLEAGHFAALQIGEQPVWDPGAWEETVSGSRSLREQLRRARSKGVSVRPVSADEVSREEAPVRQAVEGLIRRWLRSRRMAPMGFVVQLEPFTFPSERRFFVAEREGRPVGFLSMVPIYAREGWLLEDLLRDPSAPNGTAELLVDAGMRAAAAEGSRYATLGLAPLAGEVLGWLRAARRLGRGMFNFEGTRAFKAKFRPRGWDPIFLCYPPRQGSLVSVYDTLAAFAGGSLVRFGLETLLYVPELGVRALALALVPWTLVLAVASAEQWFPNRWVHLGWVAFDVALALGLFQLARKWSRPLVAALATLVTGDAFLTTLQALLFNLPRVRGVLSAVVVLVAVAAPTAAALFLWNAYHGRSGPGTM